MKHKRIVRVIVIAGCVIALAVPAFAQQQQQSPSQQSSPAQQPSTGAQQPSSGAQQPSQAGDASKQSAASPKMTTIDCPPQAAAEAKPGSQLGTPAPGSGLAALPGESAPKRIEGEIKAIDSTRTNRVVELSDVKLEVEPTTVILVGCKPATVAELKQGSKIKALYQAKEPNRNLAMVIEAAE
jgi:hypothetical protein